ncbi:hypothetical protein [Bifidobacterium cuniculi]|uniref:PE-PGRS family protein n=1 Tax=Bifidobacterium cuniculi TaxID=1688 RepID=A0A087AT81_9BIFI|nr:hypothetical protein [Bifidobacterium cuniculi]KFI61981.1 PE-PGRS family protein [Bifidobacterium cuniculi]
MPRAGQGSGGGSRGGSGFDGGRMGSGFRPSGGGSGRRAGGGGSSHGGSGFGGFPGGMPGGFGGRPPRRHNTGSSLSDLIIGAIGYQAGKSAGRREAQQRGSYGYGSAGPFGAPGQPPAGGPFGPSVPASGAGMPPAGGQPPRKGKSGSGLWVAIIGAFIVVMLIVLMVPSCSGDPAGTATSGDIPASTYNRTKLDSGRAYDTDCIDDELGWFSNVSKTESQLKTFYDKTGIQPYILFAKYNAKLTTDDEKQEWSEQWYDQHIDNEDTLLFVYFAEQDVDNDVGYMTLTPGRNTTGIMDSQAQNIFWSYLNQYWYSDMSTDEAIVTTFDKTADRIMTKTTTKQDVSKWLIIALIVVVLLAAGVAVAVIMVKRKREHEAYVERMVTTPLEEAEDPLLKKYGGDATDGATEDNRQH